MRSNSQFVVGTAKALGLLAALFAVLGCAAERVEPLVESEEPAGGVMADYPWYTSTAELVRASTLVIEGRVTGSWDDEVDLRIDPGGDDPEADPCVGVPNCEGEEGLEPVRIVEVEVSRIWSGAEVHRVLVYTPRGTAGDGPDLTIGADYLLFLAGDASVAHPLNPDQGAYRVEGDSYLPTSEANTVAVEIDELTG
ncbi:hypothetical protein [Ruania alba]|nr:hypothetical protein [Ruania alba]